MRSSRIAKPPGRARRFAILAAALTVPAIVIAAQLYFGLRMGGRPISFLPVLAVQLCHWEWWTIAGPFVWRLERRWPLGTARRRGALLRHAATAVALAVAVLALYLASYHVLVRVPVLSGFFAGMDRSLAATAVLFGFSYFHVELLIYAGIIAVAHAVHTTALLRAREHDALRLRSELTGAKLTALRAQLQPHFLFNTLHTIGSLVMQRQNERAVQVLAELGELLRGTLAHRDTDLTPLREDRRAAAIPEDRGSALRRPPARRLEHRGCRGGSAGPAVHHATPDRERVPSRDLAPHRSFDVEHRRRRDGRGPAHHDLQRRPATSRRGPARRRQRIRVEERDGAAAHARPCRSSGAGERASRRSRTVVLPLWSAGETTLPPAENETP